VLACVQAGGSYHLAGMASWDSYEVDSLIWAIDNLATKQNGTGFKAKLGEVTIYPRRPR
jgi:hypothetical protein